MNARYLRRQQIGIIFTGFLISMSSVIPLLMGVKLFGQRDVTPITFGIANVIITWGIFRYGLFDIVPIARDVVIEHAEAGVVVLDLENHVVDINPATRTFNPGMKYSPGKTFEQLFHIWQSYLQQFLDNKQTTFDITDVVGNDKKYYRLIFSPLFVQRNNHVGTLLTIYNMTWHFETQDIITQHNRNLQLAAEVSRKITTVLDIDELLPQIAQTTAEVFHLYYVAVFIFDEASQKLQIAAGSGDVENIEDAKLDVLITDDSLLVAHAGLKREVVQATDTQSHPGYRNSPSLPETRTEIALPMIVGDKLMGVLDLQAVEPNRFQEDTVRLLSNLAEQIAIAVNNSQTFQRARQLQAETEILYRIGRELNAASTYADIIHVIVSVLDANYNIYLSLFDTFDAKTAQTAIDVACWIHQEGRIAVNLQTYPAELVPDMWAGHVYVVNTISDLDFDPNLRSLMSQQNMKSALGVSLWVKERRLGTLYFLSDQPYTFSSIEKRVLEGLADVVAATTERIRLFDEQIQTAERLREVDSMKSQFLASMSHELRTPLNAILNFTEIVALEKLGSLTERQKSVLQKSLDSGKHLLDLINDVLDMTKIESGMMELFVEDQIDLYEELRSIIPATEILLKDKPVALIQDIDSNLPTILGDRRRIRQILLNLFSNAVKFTDEGSITLSVKTKSDGSLLFAVIDTGPGIPLDQQRMIFEPFVQTETGIKQNEGTGLGLPISRRLAEAHGGSLWVESEPGDGAAFYLSLPIRAVELEGMLQK
jgi:signal transduction histidine kinase/uncharacterized protein YigA (DUF484 family)